MESLRRFVFFKREPHHVQPQVQIGRTTSTEPQGNWGKTLGVISKEKLWSNARPIGFSQDALDVLFNAVRIARDEWKDDRIEPHHIVIALFADEKAGTVLRDLRIEPEKFTAASIFLNGKGLEQQGNTVDFSYAAKQILIVAKRKAIRAGDRELRPLDLLSGIISYDYSIAQGTLEAMGVDRKNLLAIQEARQEQQEADAAIDYVSEMFKNGEENK